MSDTTDNSGRSGAQGAQNPGASGSSQNNQPEYGQRKEPEYGQLSNQYPGWDPYVYGKPEPEKPKEDASAGGSQNGANQQYPSQYSAPQQNGNGANGNGQNQNGFFGFQQINPNDPAKNPFYGHWDGMSIVAFVLAFIIPVLAIPLAWMSMRRTKMLHMKGHGLAIAALVLSIVYFLLELVVLFTGVNLPELMLEWMGASSGGSTGGTGGGSGSTDSGVSARFLLHSVAARVVD